MSIDEVATAQQEINTHLHMQHCPLQSPMISLSFMQLIVIPELKITDQGLFDVKKFEYI